MKPVLKMKGGLILRACRWCSVCKAKRVSIPGSPNAVCPNGHRSARKLTVAERKAIDMEGLPEATKLSQPKLFEIEFLPGRFVYVNGVFCVDLSSKLDPGHIIAVVRTTTGGRQMVRIREFKPGAKQVIEKGIRNETEETGSTASLVGG